ncbi:hypothetical protein JRQ81_016168, partial [Phrynocephalus forsythii]
DTEVLDNTTSHYVRLYREAIEIHKHKKEESLKINKAWLPVLKTTACKRSKFNYSHPATNINDQVMQ